MINRFAVAPSSAAVAGLAALGIVAGMLATATCSPDAADAESSLAAAQMPLESFWGEAVLVTFDSAQSSKGIEVTPDHLGDVIAI